ncbi:Membrane-spanning 4-domains subfamily A member 3 [Manis javanica]|nr:Membrane-spanning 4-domains subfamily A member 3 [Manis javanica]
MTYVALGLEEKLLVFGAIEILSGTIILVLGVFLVSLQGLFNFFGYFSFFTFYSGYTIWGPIYFIFTGSSSIEAGRIPERLLVEVKIGSCREAKDNFKALDFSFYDSHQQPQMTSREVEKLQERLLALGAIEILSGVIILVLGVFLGSLQGIFDFFGEFSFFTFYSGYTIWGPVCVDVNFWRRLQGLKPPSHQQSQMTSREVDKLQERLLALGALEILSGATILVVGVFLGAIQGIFQLFEQYSYFTLYTGYPIWGPLFYLIALKNTV